MCGIIGVVHTNGSMNIDPHIFKGLVDSLKHRGPDDWGVHHDHDFSFGHRRLSIIDLSQNARQPMSDGEENVWITFNGEIYNFPDLKEELLLKGHVFRNKSDTEVIIEAYKEWGIDGLHRFNGMFAFGLYDKRNNEFYLVRDRLGVKPVYYASVNDQVVFCSELKGIIHYPGFQKELNLRAVSCFLSFRYCLGRETYFKGVHQLEPGHYLKVTNGQQQIVQYWDIDLRQRKNRLTDQDKTALKSLIKDSIQRRMISDVPLGAFLSGGIDSTIILNEMSKSSSAPVKTFTVTFGEEGYDESYYANLAATRYGAQPLSINLGGAEYFEYVRELIRFKDQPLGYHNEVASYLMAKEIRKHVTVVLSGEGADEIFSGYGRLYRSPFDYTRLRLIEKFPKFLRKPLVRLFGLNGDYLGKRPVEHFLAQYSYFPIVEKNEVYSEEMKQATHNDRHVLELFEHAFEKAAGRSYYDKISYVFEKLHLPGVMHMVDATSMATSVEVRTPFVDYRLVQAAFQIPSRYKLKWRSFIDFIKALFKPSALLSEENDITKYILRNIYKDEIPQEIIDRKKMVFPVPLTEWFTENFKQLVRKELLSETSRIRKVFDQSKLLRWIEEKEKGGDPLYGRKMWLILNLEYWMREYF